MLELIDVLFLLPRSMPLDFKCHYTQVLVKWVKNLPNWVDGGGKDEDKDEDDFDDEPADVSIDEGMTDATAGTN